MDLNAARYLCGVVDEAFLGLAIINIATDDNFKTGPILQVMSGASLDIPPLKPFRLMDRARVSDALYVGVDTALVKTRTIQSSAMVQPSDVVSLKWHREAVGKKDAFVLYDGRTSLYNVQAARNAAKSTYETYQERDPNKPWLNTWYPTPEALGQNLYKAKGRWLARVYDKS